MSGAWVRMIGVFLGSVAVAQEVPTPNPCDDLGRLSAEFMDLELAGSRWQGGEPRCLSQLKLKLLRRVKLDGPADPALLDPEYVLPKGRKVSIQTRRLPQDLIELKISYLGRRLGKDERVRDELVLKLNFGKAREEKGCVTLHRAPKYFVMREGCAED
jgi:hypothetical protein